MHVPVAYVLRELAAELLADQRMHQIERRDPAGTGDPIAVDDVKGAFDKQVRRDFRQQSGVLPMDGHAAAFHDPGRGKDHRTA